MQDPLYNATTQRFNVQYAGAIKQKLNERATKAGNHQCAECWHVKQRELLFAFPDEKTRQRGSSLECLSNLAGWHEIPQQSPTKNIPKMKPVFIGVAAYDVNETKHTSGFGAYRQGTVSIINTGAQPIKPGEHVYWKAPQKGDTMHRAYGVPKEKRVALTVGESVAYTTDDGGYLGQALAGAQPGARLDLVLCVQDEPAEEKRSPETEPVSGAVAVRA